MMSSLKLDAGFARCVILRVGCALGADPEHSPVGKLEPAKEKSHLSVPQAYHLHMDCGDLSLKL